MYFCLFWFPFSFFTFLCIWLILLKYDVEILVIYPIFLQILSALILYLEEFRLKLISDENNKTFSIIPSGNYNKYSDTISKIFSPYMFLYFNFPYGDLRAGGSVKCIDKQNIINKYLSDDIDLTAKSKFIIANEFSKIEDKFFTSSSLFSSLIETTWIKKIGYFLLFIGFFLQVLKELVF